MSAVTRCSRCGHVLTDPVSQALRMGPECRGESKKPSKRQIAHKSRVARGAAYAHFQPITLGSLTYTHLKSGWVNNQNMRVISDSQLGAWLEHNQLAIFPDQNKELLLKQREKLVIALNIDPKVYSMSGKERQELIRAIGEVDAGLREMRGSRTLVVGHGSKEWSMDRGKRHSRAG